MVHRLGVHDPGVDAVLAVPLSAELAVPAVVTSEPDELEEREFEQALRQRSIDTAMYMRRMLLFYRMRVSQSCCLSSATVNVFI